MVDQVKGVYSTPISFLLRTQHGHLLRPAPPPPQYVQAQAVFDEAGACVAHPHHAHPRPHLHRRRRRDGRILHYNGDEGFLVCSSHRENPRWKRCRVKLETYLPPLRLPKSLNRNARSRRRPEDVCHSRWLQLSWSRHERRFAMIVEAGTSMNFGSTRELEC